MIDFLFFFSKKKTSPKKTDHALSSDLGTIQTDLYATIKISMILKSQRSYYKDRTNYINDVHITMVLNTFF